MMHPASSSRAVKLLLSLPPTSTSASTTTTTTTAATGVGCGELVCLHLGEGWEERGVDLGAVGRALGLDPASVRLNGYLLGARGPDHVAASVTWRSLLAFFSARGLPTGSGGCGGSGEPVAGGAAADGPMIVQGRPAPPASLPCDEKFSGMEARVLSDRNPPPPPPKPPIFSGIKRKDQLFYITASHPELAGAGFCFHYDYTHKCRQEGGWRTESKRKLASRHESPPREEKIKPGQCRSSAPDDGEDGVSDSVLCIAKKLRLDDESPLEKMKKTGRDPGPGPAKLSACCPPAGDTLDCVMGHRKRSREDELVVTLPCKRIA